MSDRALTWIYQAVCLPTYIISPAHFQLTITRQDHPRTAPRSSGTTRTEQLINNG